MSQFEQPTRQSTIAILFILGKIFRILLKQFWILILVFFFNPKKKVFTSFTLGLLVLAGLGAITSIISYFRTYFYIKDDELILEKGVFRKTKVAVPLDRIQTVNFKQSILHQAFNVVSIEIDTAGSVGKEFSLEAIDQADAGALRSFISSNKDARLQTGTTAVERTGSAPPSEMTVGKPIFQLGILDLLKIGVSQNHFRTAGIIMVFFLSFIDDVEEALDLKLTDRLEKFLGVVDEGEIIYYLLIGVPFFLIISFLLTLFRTVFQYFNLRFWRTGNGFKMNSGLFTRQEVSANLQKIQFIRWDSSPLKRLFKMISVRLPQAASMQVARKLAVNVPGCYGDHLEAIRKAYFPEEKNLPETQHGINWRISLRMFFFQGLIPVGVLMLISQSWLGNQIWIWLLWLPAAAWLSYRYYLNWHWHVSEEGIRTSWGVINQHRILLQWYKVQAVTIRQNYFLKRRGLAHLTLFTAAGSIQVPYIPVDKALEVQDFVLYKVETDVRKWM
ncbi:MAG: PH domain-containing protein [Bacteroidota bacterium]